ncbi:unnamed protein product [Thelazia callipaeda]|uniref:SH3 domain-containing protein n=1 Tax=Thelazia callipaeda TaxID=103827 RepID=A0A158RAS1_THECL|nr:unnamed protein product [Thelazia callipaeda]
MSRVPIRVVQPPKQTSTNSTMHSACQSSASYDDLVRTAKYQQRFTEASRRLVDVRETRGNNADTAPRRCASLQDQESEVIHLKSCPRQCGTHQVSSHPTASHRHLCDLHINSESKKRNLRNVITKVTSLQEQFDVLRQRRSIALAAALEQQKILMNAQANHSYMNNYDQGLLKTCSINSMASTSNSNVISRNDDKKSKSSVWSNQISTPRMRHPHFPNISENNIVRYRNCPHHMKPRHNFSHDVSNRPQASVEPFQVNQSKLLINTRQEFASTSSPQFPAKPCNFSTSEQNKGNLSIRDSALNRDISPSPPKDPYPTHEDACDKVDEASESNEIQLNLTNHSSKQTSVTKKPSEAVDNHSLDKSEKVASENDGCVVVENELVNTNLIENAKLTKADQISIRPDTIRAAKRRSWAVQDNSQCNETEHIRKILLDEQKKGRTHLLVGCNIGDLFSLFNKTATPLNETSIPDMLITDHEKLRFENSNEKELVECELAMKDIQLDELPVENEFVLEKYPEVSMSVDEDELIEEKTTQTEMENNILDMQLIKQPPEKGILNIEKKTNNIPKKVIFDPLALLLDGALEGEMDLVKTSAAKLSNISACNDEGITALHNAICAGHYEIVRYLIDSLADVNARDSDGWTPLHCAASCNNLPMVKLLVESGACIFAQTLSDLETPSDKCEEDEDGYEGCQLYLKIAVEAIGVVNNKLMYAAYDYDKKHDDELSFRAGSCLQILEDNLNTKFWWFCKIEDDTCKSDDEACNRGLVPRNYLSLYPILSKRASNFKMFELPQLPHTQITNSD